MFLGSQSRINDNCPRASQRSHQLEPTGPLIFMSYNALNKCSFERNARCNHTSRDTLFGIVVSEKIEIGQVRKTNVSMCETAITYSSAHESFSLFDITDSSLVRLDSFSFHTLLLPRSFQFQDRDPTFTSTGE